ncbi:NAD(P)H-hydrate dehydratase [Patescibacteria group bacterium]|nr:NAD(P)H-hydrate dehydratase [Patescibacteria group bacterium]MBU1703586.1 NAD(P)H-hydrate dehydratase [Patescibacteria group bacterium]MBU1953673.1 NAD(P)H-hydrate dehydratase [Patescibacteria group bacterium]
MKDLKQSDVRKLYPRRAPDSHKGMNGRVMVVGGSIEYYGAPMLAALGALYGGADLVHLFVPECNFNVSRSIYPDFIVHSFPGDYLDMKAITPVIDFSRKCDAILIGPGLGEREETGEALLKLVKGLEIPTVLDAAAIQVFQKIHEVPSQQIVITPHHNEFETLTGKDIKISGSLSNKVVLLRTLATDLKINILLKGPTDLIASEDGEVVSNCTGNAGMTVGGSGDVLCGLVTGLIGQGATPFAACQAAAWVLGRAGDELMKMKGYNYSASDLAFEIPYVARGFLS